MIGGLGGICVRSKTNNKKQEGKNKKDLQKIGLRGKLFADKEFSKKNLIKILNKLLIKTYKNKLTKTNSRKFLKTK